MAQVKNLHIKKDGVISFDAGGVGHEANLSLHLIRVAWNRGANFEDLADGFGPGAGTFGDWSGIRDSTKAAREKMLERAINWLGLGA